MKTYELTDWGKKYKVTVEKATYAENGNLALKMRGFDKKYGLWEPFATLTVNLSKKLPANRAYVDTNNCPWAEEFIEENGLGEFCGSFGFSGYCMYPLYEFDMEVLG